MNLLDLAEELGLKPRKTSASREENTIAHVQAVGEMIDLCSGLRRTAIGAVSAIPRETPFNFAEIFLDCHFAPHA